MPLFIGCYGDVPETLLESSSWVMIDAVNLPQYFAQSCAYSNGHIYPTQLTSARDNIQSPIGLGMSALAQCSEEGLYCFADAYISNRRELLARLSLKNESRGILPDSQLILLAYRKWGIDCLAKLCGDFVFALFDQKQQKFFLVRDPMGQRSIFYYIPPQGGIYFANTVKLLIDRLHISREINRAKVASFLSLLSFYRNENTFYQHISKVPAAYYLEYKLNQQPLLKRYWSADSFKQESLHFNKREEYYDNFRSLFETVVADYISDAGPVVAHLSGGLDSSSVTAVAASLLKKQDRGINTLGHVPSIVKTHDPVPGWSYSDQVYMDALIEKFDNIHHHAICSDEQSFFSSEYYSWQDQPTLNPCNMPWIKQCWMKAKELGATTLLMGQAGNYTISWPNYPFLFRKHSYKQQVKNRLSCLKKNILQKIVSPLTEYSAIHPDLTKEQAIMKHYNMEEEFAVVEDPRFFYLSNDMMDFCSSIFMPIHYLHGITHLDPTCDLRIVEFCLRTPIDIFQEQDRSRLMVREGLKNILPPLISERKTRGLQAVDWVIQFERQKSLYRDYLQAWRHTKISEFIDIKRLLILLKRWDYQQAEGSLGSRYQYFAVQYKMKFLRAMEVGLFLEAMMSER